MVFIRKRNNFEQNQHGKPTVRSSAGEIKKDEVNKTMPEILSSFLLPTTSDRIHDLGYESRAHVKLLRFLAKNVNSDTILQIALL